MVLSATLLAGGCVTRATHDDLQRRFDTTSADLAELRLQHEERENAFVAQLGAESKRRSKLETSLDESRQLADGYARQVAGLQAVIADKRQAIASLERAVAAGEQELAQVLVRRAALKESLATVSLALIELTQRKLAAERRVSEYRDVLSRFGTLIDAGKLDVRILDGQMVLTLPMDILFASGKAGLTAAGKASLLEVGAGLATIPDRRFQVIGHTDNVPIHTSAYPSNWELGAGRSLTVLHTLLEAGVPPGRISAASKGEFQPVKSNLDEAGRAANRRIAIVIVPDLSELPGYDELEALSSDWETTA